MSTSRQARKREKTTTINRPLEERSPNLRGKRALSKKKKEERDTSNSVREEGSAQDPSWEEEMVGRLKDAGGGTLPSRTM